MRYRYDMYPVFDYPNSPYIRQADTSGLPELQRLVTAFRKGLTSITPEEQDDIRAMNTTWFGPSK